MIRSGREAAGIATLTRRSDATYATYACAHVLILNSSVKVNR